MNQFKSRRSYSEFARATKSRARFIRSRESEDFLETVKTTCTSRIEVGPANRCFWRAQLGQDWRAIHQEGEYIDDEAVPYSSTRVKSL